jgi:hypothetical protein
LAYYEAMRISADELNSMILIYKDKFDRKIKLKDYYFLQPKKDCYTNTYQN